MFFFKSGLRCMARAGPHSLKHESSFTVRSGIRTIFVVLLLLAKRLLISLSPVGC